MSADMRKLLLWGAVVGVAGVAIYTWLHKRIPTPSDIAKKIADIWLSLPFVGLPPQMVVLGSVALPSGDLVPLSSLQQGKLRQDESQSPPAVYANVQGTIYQLSPSDASGNYPAQLVGPAPAGA